MTDTTRRNFLKTTTLTAAALSTNASSFARIVGANDRVRIGIVGFSDRFHDSLLPAFQAHASEFNFDIVALSDIWKQRREEGVTHLQKLLNHDVAPARNNEELYERKDVDAVVIATADFQHAQHAIQAVHAGRDVYVEKPLAHTMADAREIRQAVKNSGKIVQIGTQRRSAPNYQQANEYLRSGQFGDVVAVEMTWNVNQPGRWRRPKLVKSLRPEDTDWRRFLINRPEVPFDPRKYVEFRLFWPYSSGIPDQWMVHQIDTVHWFTGLPRPRSVVANGGIYLWHDGRQNWDTMTAVFDYGPLQDPTKGFQVVYSSRQTNSAGSVKELYRSNAGTLDLDKNMITGAGGLEEQYAKEMDMKANQLESRALVGKDVPQEGGGDVATSFHMRNWMDCVRSRKKPNADVEAGYSHSVALCMTIAAIQTGQRVTFDDVKQDVLTGGAA
jgi:predicted dehydrogenase